MTISFDYVHVSGCDCNSDNGGSYADRLYRLRHKVTKNNFSVCGEGAWDAACEAIPHGSCLGWLDAPPGCGVSAGWPGAHRDYHILRLWEAAMVLKGAGATSWAAVEAAREARSSETLCSPAEVAAVDALARGVYSRTEALDAVAAEDGALCEAHRAAEQAERDATERLALALQQASWGAQPDGSFLTRRSTHIASGRYEHMLHAPARQGPLVEARDDERGCGVRLVAIRTRVEAQAVRAQERASNREKDRGYTLRLQAAKLMLQHGDALPYESSQAYGTVRLPSGAVVSARGALQAVGLTKAEATALIVEGAALIVEADGHAADGAYIPVSERPRLRLSLRGVERVRVSP
jgi:hypothetical protein